MSRSHDILKAEIFDDQREVSLDELCQLCGVQTALVMELVEEGVLEPVQQRTTTWIFAGTSVKRVQTAMRLQHDLDLNLPAVALVLDLLEELEELRRQVRQL